MAQDAPHLIVYPAVVGASAHEKIEKEADRNGEREGQMYTLTETWSLLGHQNSALTIAL